MANVNRILVATDLSPRADRALARAAQLASEHGASLIVVSVLEDLPANEPWTPEIMVKAEDTLRKKLAMLKIEGRVATNIRVATGQPFVEVIREARGDRTDLVIVGAHGENFLKEALFGTTAEKVVRKGDRPTLVVKRPTRGPYRQVLVAVDFSDTSRRALELALHVAPQANFEILHVFEVLFEGRLRLVGASQPDIDRYRRQLRDQAELKMEDFLKEVDLAGRPVQRHVSDGRASLAIDQVARSMNADLVAIGSSGRTGIPYVLMGSVTAHIIREAFCDVLVAHPEVRSFRLP